MKWESLRSAVSRLEEGTPPPSDAGLFGATIDPKDCALVLIPVAWDTTVSYGEGTAEGPAAILAASHQLDLEDACFKQPYRCGITMLPPPAEIADLNHDSRKVATRVIASASTGDADPKDLATVNAASKRVNELVQAAAQAELKAGRLAAVVGGDHSSPFGLIRALSEKHPDGFGILHVDAHHDLRAAYEGFEFSHASIMHNVMEKIPAVSTLVQIGIRDYSAEESQYASNLARANRGFTYYSRDLFRLKARGESWAKMVQDIVARLPSKVYISFDIDGLDPTCCPSTGTPVPGGLSFEEGTYLVEELALAGKQIIGFDLCEVAPGEDHEWDANVGARLLYKLCAATLYSNGKTTKA